MKDLADFLIIPSLVLTVVSVALMFLGIIMVIVRNLRKKSTYEHDVRISSGSGLSMQGMKFNYGKSTGVHVNVTAKPREIISGIMRGELQYIELGFVILMFMIFSTSLLIMLSSLLLAAENKVGYITAIMAVMMPYVFIKNMLRN